MRNALDKKCRENQNTHFMFGNFFPKIAPFMRLYRKMWWTPTGHNRRHNMAHTRCMLDKQGYTPAHACARPRTRAPARKHARVLTHAELTNSMQQSPS